VLRLFHGSASVVGEGVMSVNGESLFVVRHGSLKVALGLFDRASAIIGLW
jgi:hypothetical protein